MSYGFWSAMVEFNPTTYGFLKSSMLELLLTLEGADLSRTCLILLHKHIKVQEHKFTKELQPCIYCFYTWSQDRIFTLSYLRRVSSLYTSLWKTDLAPLCCMQKASESKTVIYNTSRCVLNRNDIKVLNYQYLHRI